MFDLDREGENGAKQAVLALAERCRVQYAWTLLSEVGRFRRQQPECLTRDGCNQILSALLKLEPGQ